MFGHLGRHTSADKAVLLRYLSRLKLDLWLVYLFLNVLSQSPMYFFRVRLKRDTRTLTKSNVFFLSIIWQVTGDCSFVNDTSYQAVLLRRT